MTSSRPHSRASSGDFTADVTRSVRNLSIGNASVVSSSTRESNAEDASSDTNKGLTSQQFAERPPDGALGQNVTVVANLFRIDLDVNKIPHLYEFSCTIKSRDKDDSKIPGRTRARIIFLLLGQDPNFRNAASDYGSKFFSTNSLTDNTTTPKVYFVDYFEEEEAGPRTGDKRLLFHVRLTFTRRFNTQELLDHMTNQRTAYPLGEDHITALNILLARVPAQNPQMTTTARRSKFFAIGNDRHSTDLGRGLQVYQGFFNSVRMTLSGAMVNVNTSATAMYKPMRLDHLIVGILGQSQRLTAQDHKILCRELRYVKAQTSYRGAPVRHAVKEIAKFSDSGLVPTAPNVTFDQNGTAETIESYFQTNYPGAKRANPNALVVDFGQSRSVYIPSDLCEVVPGQPYKRLLPHPAQVTAMIGFACRKPNDNRALILNKGLRQMGIGTSDGVRARFGLDIQNTMTEIVARMLPKPTYSYRSGSCSDVSDGSWNMKGKKFIQAPPNRQLNFSYFELRKPGQQPAPNLTKFSQEIERHFNLYTGGNRAKFKIIPNFDHSREPPPGGLGPAHLVSIWDNFKKNGIEVVFFILHEKSVSNYHAVKLSADSMSSGIHTMCIVLAKGEIKTDPGYIANLMLKLNLKLGGVNLGLNPPGLLTGLLEKNIMFIGADVTHPGVDAMDKAPSVAAVVATTGPDLVQYAGRYSLQVHPEERKKSRELIDNIGAMVRDLLNIYQSRNNNTLPGALIIYRDGVSDGMFAQTLSTELLQIQQTCRGLYPNDRQPKIVFIVVQKRHHVRFYPPQSKPQQSQRANVFDTRGNVKPGFVVDKTITSAKVWDFYLTSHQCIQGTSRPAHYVVLHDGVGMSADQIQYLTHSSCFLFGRATKSISVHPAARYADLMCDRARVYLRDVYNCGPVLKGERRPVYRARDHWQGSVAPVLRDTMFFV